MKKKCKAVFMCILMAVIVLLEPVSYAMAGRASGDTDSVPRLNSESLEFETQKFNDLFGLIDTPEENCIKYLKFGHLRIPNVDYSLYDLVCDFEFKTLSDGNIITSTYSYSIDLDFTFLDRIGEVFDFFDSFDFVNTYEGFDNSDKYYVHVFNYGKLLENADGFEKCSIKGYPFCYSYNTVISQADFYFVRKSDGKESSKTRYKFTWDSDFWLQKCTKISKFEIVSSGSELDTNQFSENINGVNGLINGEDDYGLKDMLKFFTEIPSSLIALIVGFIEIVTYIGLLFQAAFPFISPEVFMFFSTFILFTIVFSIYKAVVSIL